MNRNLTTIKKYKKKAALIELGFRMENFKMEIIETTENFKYVTEVQASKILGISHSKIKYLRSQGKIGYVKIGKSIRYKISQLQKFVEQGIVEAKI
jgi:excisionase family DNA binding protein